MTDSTLDPDDSPQAVEGDAGSGAGGADLDDDTAEVDDIDLDAIEADLNRVERTLEELADGTYFADAPVNSPAAAD